MDKKILLALFAIVIASGCIQTGFNAEYQQLIDLRNAYSLGEQLAPTSLEKISSFESALDTMKKNTKDSGFSSLLDIQKNMAETMKYSIIADLEIARINPAKIDCRKGSPLNNAIENLQTANDKCDLAIKRIQTFKSQYQDLADRLQKAGADSTRLAELKQGLQDKLDGAKEIKAESCS